MRRRIDRRPTVAARKRHVVLIGTLATSVVLMFVAAGVTIARMSAASPSGINTFTAATVTSSNTASTVCNVGTGGGQTNAALFPGDASTGFAGGGSDSPCTLAVTYQGTASAYLGVDVLIATKAGTVAASAPSGTIASPLYDDVNAGNGLQLQISDTTNGSSTYFVNGTTYTPQGTSPTATVIPAYVGAACPGGFTCYQITNLLVSTTAFTSSQGDTFSINYKLPSTSTSGYENSTAAVTLTVHAVQSSNNAAPTTPNSSKCFAAAACSTSFTWSS
jgi:hypothetical protein